MPKVNRSRLARLFMLLGGLAATVAVACGGEPEVVRETVVVTTAPQVQTQIVEQTVVVKETVQASPQVQIATPTPGAQPTSPPDIADSRVTRGIRNLEAVFGIRYQGPYAGGATRQIGGVTEYMFHYDNGDPMGLELADSWSIDPAGTKFTMGIREGVKWQSPRGWEEVDFGEFTAHEFVEWFNRANATTNPDSTHGDRGDYAAIFLNAVAIDDYNVEIGLVTPVYFCVPISQFGCLSAAEGPEKVTTVELMGYEWAKANHVGTGPYVQGICVPGDRCTLHAIEGDHWRVDMDDVHAKELVGIQVPESQARIAMLRNGQIDLTEMDFKLVPGLLEEGFQYLETMPSGFVGDSIIFSGNLWEEFHVRTSEPMQPWATAPYEVDYPWIGNPWGHGGQQCEASATCGEAPYTDTDNPPGMDDMEQARLVRLALSMAINRDEINDVLFGGLGTPIYSEYMGPEYPGWDPARSTGAWDWLTGETVAESGTKQSVPWQLEFNLQEADRLLTEAGYPRPGGTGQRQNWNHELTLQSYPSEIGEVALEVADTIASTWGGLGIPIGQLIEDYAGVISPRMRDRIQLYPVLKNGDVHSNVYPLDWPFPTVDTSSSRPGWGVGFESQPAARWLFEILGEQDKAVREQMHLDWADYSMFWVQYAGVGQIPKGIVAGPRVESWVGRQQHYSNVSSNPEFIKLVR